MKYENFDTAKKMIAEIKQNEAILNKLANEDGKLSVIVYHDNKLIKKFFGNDGLVDLNLPDEKAAGIFISDYIQTLRDKLTDLKSQLEVL